jgi:hypothetical protein
MTRLTRRGALATLGALAGCSAVNPLGDGSRDATELDGTTLRAAVDDSPPIVPAWLPVDIGADHLAATERRARTLLDSASTPFGPDEIPNGAIRERMNHAHEHTVERLSEATEAPTPFERLTALAAARADARFVAAAWRAVDEGLDREALDAEAATVREDRAALRDRRRYVGADPVDATLVHAAIERRLDRADADADEPTHHRDDNPLGVGETAEDVERARAALDDAAYLYDRLTASLSDPVDLRPRLVDAHERLREAFDSARADVDIADPARPWVVDGETAVDRNTPVAGALRELYWPIARRSGADPTADEAVAQSLLTVHRMFVDLRAFESLRNRVVEGETFAVETAEDAVEMRAAAVEAVRAAEAAPKAPALTRWLLGDLTGRLVRADDGLADVSDRIRAASIRREAMAYLVVAARAWATPPASERVAAALRA